jgi:hypothetical protein
MKKMTRKGKIYYNEKTGKLITSLCLNCIDYAEQFKNCPYVEMTDDEWINNWYPKYEKLIVIDEKLQEQSNKKKEE